MNATKRNYSSWLNACTHAAPTEFGCLMASVAVSLPLIQSWSNLALKRGDSYTKRLSKSANPLIPTLRLNQGERTPLAKKSPVAPHLWE